MVAGMGGVCQMECQGKWPVAATSGENHAPPLPLKSTLLPTVAFLNLRGKMNDPCYPGHPWLNSNSFILLREKNLSSVSCQTGPACAHKAEAKATQVFAGFSVQSSLPAKNAFFSPQSKFDLFRWLVIQHQLVTVNSVTPPNQA